MEKNRYLFQHHRQTKQGINYANRTHKKGNQLIDEVNASWWNKNRKRFIK